MEDIFNKLISEGKNTVEGVIQWMKDAKILDDNAITEGRARDELQSRVRSSNIKLVSLKDTVDKLAHEYTDNIDHINKQIQSEASSMEGIFEQMKKEGTNSVDNLIKWLKDSKIVDGIKVTEKKARELLENTNKMNVELEQFKTAVNKMAAEHKKDVAELHAMLNEESVRLKNALEAGASAFKEAMKKK